MLLWGTATLGRARGRRHTARPPFLSVYPHLDKNSPWLCSPCSHLHRRRWAWEYARSYATHHCYSFSNYHCDFPACACCYLRTISDVLGCVGWHNTLHMSAWHACSGCNRARSPCLCAREDSSCHHVCHRRNWHHRGACIACAGHADDDGGHQRWLERRRFLCAYCSSS